LDVQEGKDMSQSEMGRRRRTRESEALLAWLPLSAVFIGVAAVPIWSGFLVWAVFKGFF
jgi:cytoskeletal protein RodZ